MAVPTYTNDLIDWIADADTTAWLEFTNMASGGVPDEADTESALQGTNTVSQATNTTALFSMGRILGASVTLATNDVFLVWHGHGVATALLPYASGGLRLVAATTLGDWKAWAVGGNDVPPFPYGKWVNNPIDPTIAGEYTLGTPPAALTFFGVGSAGQLSAAVSKGQPHVTDMIRYGRAQSRFTGGETANFGTFAGFAALNDAASARWGLISTTSGGYLWKGLMKIGLSTVATTFRARTSNVATLTTAAAHGFKVGDTLTMTGIGGTGYNATAVVASVPTTTTFTYANTGGNEGSTIDVGGSIDGIADFRDSNTTIFIQDTRKVYATFNKIEMRNASTNVAWSGINFVNTAPTTNASDGDFEVVDNATVVLTACIFTDWNTFILLGNTDFLSCQLLRCNTITSGGGLLTGTSVLTPTVAADTSAVIWNLNVDPDGFLDDMTFSKGTNAHHAIELGLSSPLTVTLRGINFTGFNTANEQNDSVIHIKRTASTVTINAIGCTGTVSYKSAGAGVDVIVDSVTSLVNVKDSSSPPVAILEARVFVKASNNTGPLPFEEAVTIVNLATLATVTHNSHGMLNNDKVVISGASLEANNGIFTITRLTDNTYTYTMGSSPGSNPTGAISTYVAISGETDASGNISMSRVFATDQPVVGWARKTVQPNGPFYKTGPISGSIDSVTGFSANVQLISDE